MLTEPMDILKLHPIRKTKAQKEVFRSDALSYARSLGYDCRVEKGSFGAQNIIIGNPEKAEYLITAHYDTPASIGLPNVLTPCNPVTYILWQFFVVGIFMLAAILPGVALGVICGNSEVGGFVSVLLYWTLLLLMLFGPANKRNANDNTSGVVTVLEIARSLDSRLRGKVCFILFDLEEAGLIGSSGYRKAHKKETEGQIVLNLDCVGDGDHIIFFPTKKARKNETLMAMLHRVGGWFGTKHIQLKKKGFYTYPSDQRNFPLGIGIAAFRKKRGIGYFVDKIHTGRDTVLDITNVNLLRAAIITLITAEQ